MADYSIDFIIDPDKLEGYPSYAELEDFTEYNPTSNYTFIIDQYILDGYPSILGNFTSKSINSIYMFKTSPYYLEGYPYMKGIFTDTSTTSPYMFKTGSIHYIDGYPYLKGIFFNKNHWLSIYLFTPDQDYLDSYPTLGAKTFDHFGCGKDSDINELEIPRSVLYIADWAFYNSNINSVKINRHCTYFKHSFPPGCHIKPYADKNNEG